LRSATVQYVVRNLESIQTLLPVIVTEETTCVYSCYCDYW